MRKSIAIVLAVAIIGALGLSGKSHGSSSLSQSSSNTSTLGANTSSSTPNTNSSSPNNNSSSSTAFKDGTYTGSNEDTPYGTVQVAVVVSGGQITNVNFLQMPNDLGHSREITAYAEPLLKQETIQKQSAQLDFVSGATSSSEGYMLSLQSALDQAA